MKKLLVPAGALLLAVAALPSHAQTSTSGKVSSQLLQLTPATALPMAGSPVTASTTSSEIVIQQLPPPTDGATVVIDAIAEGDPNALASALVGLGATDCAVAGRVVSASLPISAISSLEGLGSLRYARASLALSNAGSVTTQGDAAMRAQLARPGYSVDGTGVRVGVLSDSFNAKGGMATDVASNDLPSTPQILLDAAGSTDEGRAMAQIVHDVAPGSPISFYSAMGGEADFANGIRALKDAGCKVIVDDILYLNEPMFADGVVAQAVDEVAAAGVSYFSAAGNGGQNSYQAAFKATSDGYHNFDPGTGTDTVMGFNFMAYSTVYFILQWPDRYASCGLGNPGAATDLDLEFVHQDGTPWLVNGQPIGSFDNNLGQDPVEVLAVSVGAPTDLFYVHAGVKIRLKSGAVPPLVKLVWYTVSGSTGQEQYYTDSSTLYGHMNARGALAVGAAWYCNTPAFGISPPSLEYYSSMGGTPIYYNPDGTAHYEVRNKPDFTAPDGGDNTFFGSDRDCSGTDGFPNFFGTSAAAPHAAAVAALMLQAQPAATPDQVRSFLQSTAIDMLTSGFDFKSGYGLVQADAALAKATQAPTAANQSKTSTEDLPLPVTLSATDPNGFPLTFAVVTAPAHGTLSGTAPNLVYTPALNYTGADSFAFKASNGFASSAPATVSLTVTPVNDAPVIATGPVAAASPVVQTSTTVSTTGSDVDGPAALTYAWSQVSGPAAVAFANASASSTTVTFAAAGSYVLRVTASDGLLSTSEDLPVTVAAVLARITVTPASATMPTGSTKQFSKTAKDQFGKPLNPQPTVRWSVSGGGTIDENGLFSADSATAGSFEVAATADAGGTLKTVGGVAIVGMSEVITLSPPVLQSVVSRKTHGVQGTYDVPLTLTGNPAIEPRNDSNLKLVFTFDRNIASATASVQSGIATLNGSAVVSGSTVTVQISSVRQGQWLTVALANVTGSDGSLLDTASVRLGVLACDIDGNGVVNGTDVYMLRLMAGAIANAVTFRRDVDLTGAVNGSDVYMARLYAGRYLPVQ